jgi:cytoskeleton protein RodZ
VRSYARLLKLDPDPLLARIAGRFDAPDSNQLAARFSQPVPFSDHARRSTLVYLGFSLAILVVVGGIAYQWQRDRNAPRQMAFVKPKAEPAPAATAPAPRPPAPAVVAEAPAPVERKVEEKRVEEKKVEEKRAEEKKPPPEKKAPSIVQATAAPVSSGSHRVVLRVETDEAWLEVTDATGRQLVSSLNRAGSERVVQGRGPFTFVIGNASHVRVEHNGREFDLKPHTRVEVARFTIP